MTSSESPITTRSVQSPITISVVIPVRNGDANFHRCLEAIRDCDPPAHEVVVVDDGSTDGSADAAREWGARVLSTARAGSGPAEARNIGAQEATGDVVLFVDADVALHRDAIGRVLNNFASNPECAACFGSYDDSPGAPNFLSQYKNLFHHYVHQSARADASTFWAGCGAIRRNIFLRAGGFSGAYHRPAIEDIELGYRLRAAGYRLRLDKALQGKHLKQWTWRSLLRSDIFDRGVPWTELILRGGAFVDDLNLQTRNRVSVAAMVLLLMTLLAGIALRLRSGQAWPIAWAASAGLAIALLAMNMPVYRFFAAKRGWVFALRVIPMHWLYYGYNGVSFTIGVARHLRRHLEMPPTPNRQQVSSAMLLLVLLIGAGFRFVNLGSDSFWYDELLQVNIAAQDIPTLLSQLGQHAAMPLDYFITRAVLAVGRGEYLLRFPAAFWGILTLPLAYQIGRRLFGQAVGIGAALLLALSGLHVFYSQELRPYALLTFLVTLSFYWLVRVFQDGRHRYWIGYSLTIAAGVLTHHFILFVIGAQGLIVLGGSLAGWATARGRSTVAFGLALVPLALALAITPWSGSVLDVGRLFVVSIVAPDTIPAGSQLGALRGDATPIDLEFFQNRLLGGLSGGGPALPIVSLILLLAGSWVGFRRARGQTALALTWAFVPAALIIAFLYHRGTFFALRYILFALPAFLLLVALGAVAVGQASYAIRNTQPATRNPQPVSRIAFHVSRVAPFPLAASCILLLGLAGYQAGSHVSSPRENWREAGRFLVENVRPEDVVIAPQRADIVYFYAPMRLAQVRPSTLPKDLPERLAANQRLWLVTSQYIYPVQAYYNWIGLRPHVEYRVDDAVQVFLVAQAGDKASLLRAARSIRPPETWSAWATLADQYEVAGDVEWSTDGYRRAIALADSSERTIGLTLRLAGVLRRARRFDQAAIEYRRVLKLDPRSVDGLANLGRVYLEQGRLNEARAPLMEAVSIDPQSYAANLFLADLYQREGEFDRAAAHYARAAQIVPELITPP